LPLGQKTTDQQDKLGSAGAITKLQRALKANEHLF
jgi:hypothetical protein